MIKIIEDHSPFYILFQHDNIDKIVSLCQKELENISTESNNFVHHRLSESDSETILSVLPYRNTLPLQEQRVSMFVSGPGYKHFTHIDRACASINYGIYIKNEKCITNWYNGSDIKKFKLTSNPYNRGIVDDKNFDTQEPNPLKSFVFKENQSVLLNTQYFHNFNNTDSEIKRVILTIRPKDLDLRFGQCKFRMFS